MKQNSNDRKVTSEEDADLGLASIDDHLLNPMDLTAALPVDEDFKDYLMSQNPLASPPKRPSHLHPRPPNNNLMSGYGNT